MNPTSRPSHPARVIEATSQMVATRPGHEPDLAPVTLEAVMTPTPQPARS